MSKRWLFVIGLMLTLIVLTIVSLFNSKLKMTEINLTFEENELTSDLKEDLILNGIRSEDLDTAVVRILEAPLLEEKNLTIYKVAIDFKWLEGVLVYHKDEYMGYLPFMLLDSLYLIEGNGKDGLLAYGTAGSGLLYNQISYLRFRDRSVQSNSFFNDMKGFDFKIVEDNIMVYSYDLNLQRVSTDPIGELILTDGLSVEGLEPLGFE